MAEHELSRIKIEIPQLLSEKEAFSRRIIGQPEAVDAFAVLFAKLQSGIRPSKPGPLDIKFLAGPSGVGKTEMVLLLAELLSPDEANPRGKVIKLNGGEYQQEHSISRLFGAPPGYRGSDDPLRPGSGAAVVFSQANLDNHRIFYKDRAGRDKSVVLILVDEAEKADEALHKAFLSVLDKGQMDLANNSTSDFSNTVIFYTSNVGNSQVEQARRLNPDLPKEEAKEIFDENFRNAFPPEFRGRIKELVVFNNLDQDAIKQIVTLKIKEVERSFADNGVNIELELSPAALERVIQEGYNPSEGARALEKVIESRVHDQLILAHVGMDINRKRLYVDYEEGDVGLSFYFNNETQLPELPTQPQQVARATQVQHSRPQPESVPLRVQEPIQPRIPEPLRVAQPVVPAVAQIPSAQIPPEVRADSSQTSQPEQAIPQIPAQLKADLIFRIREVGLDSYVHKRDELARLGLLDPQVANAQPEIQQKVFQDAVFRLEQIGLASYIHGRDAAVRAGILRPEQFNNSRSIRDLARRDLSFILKNVSQAAFVRKRDEYVRAGIGTVEEWNKLLS